MKNEESPSGYSVIRLFGCAVLRLFGCAVIRLYRSDRKTVKPKSEATVKPYPSFFIYILFAVTSCTSSTDTPVAAIQLDDSLTVASSPMRVHSSICFSWCTRQGTPLSDSINQWTFQTAFGQSVPTPLPTDVTAHLVQMQRQRMRADSLQLAQWLTVSPPPDISVHTTLQVTKIYEDADFVTFQIHENHYNGGAHDANSYDCATFIKQTDLAGKRLGWNLLNNIPPTQLQSRIKTALAAYLDLPDESQLYNLLYLPPHTPIPLPTAQPYLTAQGITLRYQEYELGPFAIGSPEIVVGEPFK